MLLNVSTDNLYDPIIALYEALFRGEREHTLRITLREDFNPVLLTHHAELCLTLAILYVRCTSFRLRIARVKSLSLSVLYSTWEISTTSWNRLFRK